MCACVLSCGRIWFVCEVVLVPYVVGAVVALAVMRVMLLVLNVSMPRERWSARVGDTRGSGIVYSAADVIVMSVVRGMREVGGVFEMCMCFVRGRVGC